VNLFSLLPSILKAVGSVLGIGVVKDAGAALAAAQISPEQQVALQEALLVHEKEMAQINLDELKTAISESVAMIQSDDVYTKRARPTALYAATGITAGLAIAMIFGQHLDTGALTALLLPLWGAGGYYIYSRTQEKLSGRQNS